MLLFKIGNTTVHLWPLIIVFLIALIGVAIHAILLYKKNRRIMELCRAGEYKDSITLAEKQLNYYQRTLKNKNTKSVMELLYLYLAISNLALSNDEQFIHNITQVDDKISDKHFWLALFYLRKNDSANFQIHYDVLSVKEANADYLSYLTSINKLQEKDDIAARSVLVALHPKLNFKILQDISKKFVDF